MCCVLGDDLRQGIGRGLACSADEGGKALNQRNEVQPSDPSKPQSYFEVKCVAPDDQVIDVSNAGWVGASK